MKKYFKIFQAEIFGLTKLKHVVKVLNEPFSHFEILRILDIKKGPHSMKIYLNFTF